jgi:DNA-binding response OmpR family regulator
MKKKIDLLLVDDEREFREATSRALSRRGFEVREAESGEEALEALAAHRPEVVVLDLRMPGLGGIETLRELRAIHEDLPVIILTGQGTLEDAVSGIRMGIADFIQKPADVDLLSSRIRLLIDRGEQQRLHERSIAELMVPVSAYRRVYLDQKVREVIRELSVSLTQVLSGEVAEQGHRSLLVYDRGERFVGVLTLNDVLAHALPVALRGSPYSSYLTGMFIAQCKLIGDAPVGDLLERRKCVDLDAPLMEALNLMVTERMINLPVLDGKELKGVLRDKDLLLEIAGLVSGGVRRRGSPFGS